MTLIVLLRAVCYSFLTQCWPWQCPQRTCQMHAHMPPFTKLGGSRPRLSAGMPPTSPHISKAINPPVHAVPGRICGSSAHLRCMHTMRLHGAVFATTWCVNIMMALLTVFRGCKRATDVLKGSCFAGMQLGLLH